MRDHTVQRRGGSDAGTKPTGSPIPILQKYVTENPALDGRKDDFNLFGTWMKHPYGPDEMEVDEWIVLFWLNRAISKYRAVYGIGTSEMAGLFPWAGRRSRASKPG